MIAPSLSKSLLALVSDVPPTLQLNFEPSGKPGKDRNYYLIGKQNICVVCGSSDDCVRKNIVPHEYRRSVLHVDIYCILYCEYGSSSNCSLCWTVAFTCLHNLAPDFDVGIIQPPILSPAFDVP